MSEEGEHMVLSAEDKLLRKHRKEKKELQGKVQALKKSVCKGDKRKKKDMCEEISRMEAELERRHEEELSQLEVDQVTHALEQVVACESSSAEGQGRASKTQRKKEKRVQKEKERQMRMAEGEAEMENSIRTLEEEKIKRLLGTRHLMLHEIYSDGNCMYSALEHQLRQHGEHYSFKSLREKTAEFLRCNSLEFLPFLSSPSSDGPMTQEEFEKYCYDIVNTQAWGGHLELQALSQVLQHPIEVIQAEGPSIVIGEEHQGKPTLLLTYHRHAYSLGEHYNSVEPYKEIVSDDL